MPEVPPDQAFLQSQQTEQMVDEFCENNYEDNKKECKMMIADRLFESGQSQEPEPQPQPEAPPEAPPQDPGGDPVQDTIDPQGNSIETLIADCVGGGFLGFHRPNTESCMRAVAKHERERR